jgi:probable HAF family extracellular repeat protein
MFLALMAALVSWGSSPAAMAAPLYQVLDLGQGVQGTDLNERGQVVGTLNVGGHDRAFITGRNGAGMTVLATLGGPASQATGVNASGQVVGVSYLTDDIRSGPYRAFLTGPDGAGITDLGTLGGPSSVAQDVNDDGRVIGWADITATEYRSFLTGAQGVGMGLFAPGGQVYTTATRINASGQVAGVYNDDGENFAFITLADGAGVMPLGPGEASRSPSILGINDDGMVSGGAWTAGAPWRVAFVTGPDGSDLRTLWPTASEAYDINDFGLAVGYYVVYPEVTRHAFVYGLGGQALLDLNTLVDLPGVVLNEAVAINDRGQILANSGNGRAYLLTPVPEPATAVLLMAGLAVVLRRAVAPRRSD